MTKPYRPSNHTEFCSFESRFCGQCERMAEGREPCGILGRTLGYSSDAAEYPKELIVTENGPVCTAFVMEGEPIPEPRCADTIDLFGE